MFKKRNIMEKTMDYITRDLEDHLKRMAEKFPVVTITGPRQSGKTTLVRHAFPQKKYVSCEDPDIQIYAAQDPRGFLETYHLAVIDEAQKVPQLFSYIQTKVDQDDLPGQYILTGSSDFLLLEKISQTLAGRTAVLRLMPFSLNEIQPALNENKYETYLFSGFYPRIHKMEISPLDFFPGYVQTYIERDVRAIKNITNLGQFQVFLKMCAGRCGQLLNLSSLSNECGISQTTAKSWISVLEASYIIFLLRPHHQNYNKRLIKMPKLYFYDPGLAAYLLGIQSVSQIDTHYLKGALFETMIISEIMKHQLHQGRATSTYFWRDKLGHEVDCIIDQGVSLTPVEIKSGRTLVPDYFKGLDYYMKLAGSKISANPCLIYGGEENQTRKNAAVISWLALNNYMT